MNLMRRGAVAILLAASLGVLGACSSDSSGTGGSGGSVATGGSGGTGGAAMESCDKAALQANKDLALRVSLEVFLKGAPSDGILSKDFVAHSPGGQPDQGVDAFLGFGTQFRAALPDAAFTFTHVVAEGDFVALRYIGTGTHEGELFGVPASHNALRWEGMVIRRMAGGLVVEEWNAPDSAGLFGQLTGMTPALSPDSADHTGAGDCTASLLSVEKDFALRVSKEVVLQGASPDELISPAFVMHNPNGLPDLNLEGFLGFNAGLRAAFPDAAFTFTHVIAEGGLVHARYTATATHSGEFLGIPATGKQVAWEGMFTRRFDGGKLVEEWNGPDMAGLIGQLTSM